MNTQETTFNGMKINGFAMLFIHLVILTAAIVACFFIGKNIFYGIAVLLIIAWLIIIAGYMQLEPNEARAMVFFGKYKAYQGERQSGQPHTHRHGAGVETERYLQGNV